MFVFSPSNMSTFRDCPRKFQGQSLTKEIKWKDSPAKNRGIKVHKDMESIMLSGGDTSVVKSWDSKVNKDFVQQQIRDVFYPTPAIVRAPPPPGPTVFTEYEMCVNQKFEQTGWWDTDAFLRAKADAYIDYGGPDALLIDFKTGKKWDTDAFQLRVEALLVHVLHKKHTVSHQFWYVDSGELVEGLVDFRRGLAPVQDIIDLMKTMQQCIRDNYFPEKKNKFCKWCGLYEAGSCSLHALKV